MGGRRGSFHDEVQVANSPVARKLWLASGLASLALGLIGIFLPILPTVPFAVVAVFCFARCSPRFYNKALSNKHFGPAVFEWVKQRTIHKKAKIVAILVIIASFALSIVFFVPNPIARAIMGSAGLAIVIWLLTVPVTR